MYDLGFLKEHWKQRSNGFLVDYANGRLDAPVKSEGDGDQSRDTSNGDTGLNICTCIPTCTYTMYMKYKVIYTVQYMYM